MQIFQIKKNDLEQVINVTMQPVKCLKKYCIKRRIKQTLVRHVIYQQGIFKHHIRKLKKKIEEVFMENWFVSFSSKK